MRLLVVSNRLPVTVVKQDGKLTLQESAGGLVSGLRDYLASPKRSSLVESDYLWLGWPGSAVPSRAKAEVRERLLDEFHAYPVFISEHAMERFYHGFCNRTVWPLFHYFPSYAGYHEEYWSHYVDVNRAFRDAVLEVARPDDLIWVHDYHLMLLPGLLREQMPEARIGFFLHIPFPDYEVFRLLPSHWRGEILKGLLGADLVGFHTYDYAQYFLRCVARIVGYESDMGRIYVDERVARADTFPMGIDFKRFNDAANSAEVQSEREGLQETLRPFKVILSIDRLDYTKGPISRLNGYERFLEKYPELRGKAVLVLVVVPSRVGVEEYQRTKRQVDELVGKINGRYGSIDWTPIRYQYRTLPFHSMVALYGASDVALVTPLRDGMNLVAKEYLAAKSDGSGVLILSEMAGAAKELGEAVIINPNDSEEIADALKEALEMPGEEQTRNNDTMRRRLARYDVVRWADDFISTLLEVKREQQSLEARLLNASAKERLVEDFARAKKRLVIVEYQGVLVPFSRRPELAAPTERVLNVLRRLAEDRSTDLVLISGRERDALQRWFGELRVGLVAEHGVWIKQDNEEWRTIKTLTNEWKRAVLPALERHVDRLPGSFVEEKEYSVVWNYLGADPELGATRAKEVVDELSALTANVDVQVVQGNRLVELRNAGIDEGTACLHWINRESYDFITVIGDGTTDGEIFRALPPLAYSIKIGMGPSYARFNLPDHRKVIELLEKVAVDSSERETGR